MKYECNCIPEQEYPHLTRTSHTKSRFITIPCFGKRIIIAHLSENLSPAKSCDGHPIPLKRWELIKPFKIRFGKIIY